MQKQLEQSQQKNDDASSSGAAGRLGRDRLLSTLHQAGVILAQSHQWRGRQELACWHKLLSGEIALRKGQSRIKVKATLTKFTEKEIQKAGSEKP